MGVFIHNFSLIVSGYVHVHKISRQQCVWNGQLVSNDFRIMGTLWSIMEQFRDTRLSLVFLFIKHF